MDRRSFLRTVIMGAAAMAIPLPSDVDKIVEQTLTNCVNMSDDDFITYVKFSINLLIDNPARIAIITEIVE